MATKTSAVGGLYDKYKPASVKDIKNTVAEENSIIDRGNTDRLKLVDGLNKIRIFPKHPGEKSFMKLYNHYWVTLENEKGETYRRTITDGKTHGGLKQSLIEIYTQMAKDKLSDGDLENTNKIKQLSAREGGLKMTTVWVLYAATFSGGELGPIELWEIKRTLREGINSETTIEDEDDPIELDPFTDPQTGKLLQFVYNSKAKKSTDYYKSIKLSDKVVPIPLDVLEEFDKMTPLSELPRFKYSDKDFENELNALRLFDETNEIEVFESDEFQNAVRSIKRELKGGAKTSSDDDEKEDSPAKANFKKSLRQHSHSHSHEEDENEATDELPFDADEDEEPKTKQAKIKSKPAKKVEPEEEEEEEEEESAEEDEDVDQFEGMDRKALILFKQENELECKLVKSDSDEEIRNKVRAAWLVKSASEEEEEEAEIEEEEEEVPIKNKKTAAPPAVAGKRITLDDIKKKLGTKAKK